MSKYGFVSKDLAARKFESDPSEAAAMVSEMSSLILEQEKAISTLKDELLNERMSLGGARAAEAHLRGYVERVREADEAKEKVRKAMALFTEGDRR